MKKKSISWKVSFGNILLLQYVGCFTDGSLKPKIFLLMTDPSNLVRPSRTTQKALGHRENAKYLKMAIANPRAPNSPGQRNHLKFFSSVGHTGKFEQYSLGPEKPFSSIWQKSTLLYANSDRAGHSNNGFPFLPRSPGGGCSSFVVLQSMHLPGKICLLHSNCFEKAFWFNLWVASSPRLLSCVAKDSQMSGLTIKRDEL